MISHFSSRLLNLVITIQGIVVETPEERKAKNISNIMKEADPTIPAQEVSYVVIPANTSQPLQEFVFTPTTTQFGDALQEHLKPYFASNSEQVDISLLQQNNQQLLGSSTSGEASVVSPEALTNVAKQGHVEVFTLVHPIPGNQFTGVNIYLDEVGMLKRLPLNTRASHYAEQAGYKDPCPQFYGNVVMGRIRKRGAIGVTEHVSFRSGVDTDARADWLQRAATCNLEYQMEMNQITGRQDDRQPGVDGSNGVAKEETGYSWTQTEEELEVVVALPDGATVNSKDLQVVFKTQCLQISCRKTALVSLELFERVDVDGCTWILEKSSGNDKNSKKLVVTMEKMEQALWPRIKN
jgi:hypothetical protein